MVASSALLAFALASLVLVVVPGPSVLFVIGRSIAFGRRAGVRSIGGNALDGLTGPRSVSAPLAA